jgi:hypothetical protein
LHGRCPLSEKIRHDLPTPNGQYELKDGAAWRIC